MNLFGHMRALVGIVPRRIYTRDVTRFLNDTQNCRQIQQQKLAELLEIHRTSSFSRDHQIDRMRTHEDFRSEFPVTNYDNYHPYIEKLKQGEFSALHGPEEKLLMFSLSSGTTANSKFIPITERFLADYRRGWKIWGVTTLNEHAPVRPRHIVQITSDHDRFKTEAGTPCGNISGLVAQMQAKIVHSMYTIPSAIAKIDSSEAKMYTAVRLALADPEVAMITTANPSTLIQWHGFAKERAEELIKDIQDGTLSVEIPNSVKNALGPAISKRRPARARALQKIMDSDGELTPQKCWPFLTVLAVWTGGSAGSYLPRAKELYGDLYFRDHGLHASEGRMTIPFEAGESSGVLDYQTHYFEFIPAEEYENEHRTILEAHELEEGQDYYLLLTTSSGFYRYDICDVVRCAGFMGTTPLLKFLHKGAHISNITGEKVTEHQVLTAVETAKQKLGIRVGHYSVAPNWDDPPYYQIVSDLPAFGQQQVAEALVKLADSVDEELMKLNCEYREKRGTGRLQPMRHVTVSEQAWRLFSKKRQQGCGGNVEQYKHPCLIPKMGFVEEILGIEAEVRKQHQQEEDKKVA